MPSRIINYYVASENLKEINLNKELFLLGNRVSIWSLIF